MAKEDKINSVGLVQLEGGYRVKQGDKASLFAYRLVDERGDSINLNEEQATVRLVKGEDYEIIYELETVVVGDVVSFTIDQILPLGGCWVEILAGGYVFPSDNRMKLLVTRSATAYQLADLVEVKDYHEHRQDTPAENWEISHDLMKYPSVTVIDSAGNVVYGHVQYLSKSRVRISFSAAFSGRAILN